MYPSREIAGGNREILDLRIGGENVTAHRQMKTHREALISAGEGEKNPSKPNLNQHYFSLFKNQPQYYRPFNFICFIVVQTSYVELCVAF